MLNIQWTPGETGAGHVTGYVIEARPSGTALKTFFCLFLSEKPVTTYQYYQVNGLGFFFKLLGNR